VVKVLPGEVELAQAKPYRDAPDIMRELKEVASRGEEGLILKRGSMGYHPGDRHWWKLKQDYLAGMADTLDLVVLGAYRGKGAKGGLLSAFLMGCFDPDSQQWKTVCKVGSGFDEAELKDVQQGLLQQMVPLEKGAAPPGWLQVHKNLLPDMVIVDPRQAPVWEIAGSEFTRSPVHTAQGLSLRFPRLLKTRADKDFATHTNLSALVGLAKLSNAKKRSYSTSARPLVSSFTASPLQSSKRAVTAICSPTASVWPAPRRFSTATPAFSAPKPLGLLAGFTPPRAAITPRLLMRF
jgi:DNA ligase-3